ncbi:MAG: Uma2 family endonuclease [Hamadaea sp.]|nr:Uma2 family endonuclease [Hamadaea sp.]
MTVTSSGDDVERAYPESGRERPLITLDLAPADWTVDDIERLPHDGYRYELHEGSLVIMSPAIIWHNRVAVRLAVFFGRAGRSAATEVGIRFGDRSTRIADVAVFAEEPDENLAHVTPDALAIVVEIVSPESRERDIGSKPAKYAAAGIPEFWRVERDEEDPRDAHVFRFRLEVDGSQRYAIRSRHRLSQLEKDGLIPQV